MAYGDSQYGNFQFQFDPSFLSNIISMAQARKQKQQQQQQEMVKSAIALSGSAKNWWDTRNAMQNATALNAGNSVTRGGVTMGPLEDVSAGGTGSIPAGSGDPNNLRIMAYGPSQGEYTHDTMYGPLGALQQGDVAVSPNLASRFPLRSKIQIGRDEYGRPKMYRVADWSYYHPGEPTSNTVEIWNGEDLGYQPVQRFARGGVVSWSDPYGNEPLAAQEYVRSVPLADVSGMANIIARQNEQKQQMYQQNMQNAFNAATKIMQQRQTDAIGKALIQNNPELSQDPRTWDMINAGVNPLQVAQVVGQQQADEADAKRQATADYWTQQRTQADINKSMGLDLYGRPLPKNTVLSGGKEWLQDENGNWHQVTGNAALKYQEAKTAPNPYEDRYKMFTMPDVVTYWNKDYSQKLSTQDAEANPDSTIAVLPDKTTMPYADYKKMAGQVVNKYYANKAPTDNPSDNQTGTAPPVTTQDTATVRVQSPNGQTGTIPASRLKAYLAAGWKQI